MIGLPVELRQHGVTIQLYGRRRPRIRIPLRIEDRKLHDLCGIALHEIEHADAFAVVPLTIPDGASALLDDDEGARRATLSSSVTGCFDLESMPEIVADAEVE